MFTPELGHGAIPMRGCILNPPLHLLHCATTDVAANIGFAPKLFTKIEKFVGAKRIVLRNATPVSIDHARALRAWANSVLPVVFIGKTAARPA